MGGFPLGSMAMDASVCTLLPQRYREQETNARDSMEASTVEGVRLSGQGTSCILSHRPFSRQGALGGQWYKLALVLPALCSFHNVGIHC